MPSALCRGAPAAVRHWACSTLPRAVVPSCGGLVCSWENLHGVTGVTGLVLQTRERRQLHRRSPGILFRKLQDSTLGSRALRGSDGDFEMRGQLGGSVLGVRSKLV